MEARRGSCLWASPSSEIPRYLQLEADTFHVSVLRVRQLGFILSCLPHDLLSPCQILLLDEPTAGMDPCSRHQVWSLLKNRRAGRVTVLSTHYMDEADILAGGNFSCYVTKTVPRSLVCCDGSTQMLFPFFSRSQSCDLSGTTEVCGLLHVSEDQVWGWISSQACRSSC